MASNSDIFITKEQLNKLAFKQNAYDIQYIKEPSVEVQKLAVEQNGYAGTIDNYTGTTLRYAASINIYGSQNQINSCRLYYLNDSNELTNDLIS